MVTLNKRATVYLESVLHKALKLKAAETDRSVSEIVNEALRHELAEDEQDIAAFRQRAKEPTVSYESLLKKLKMDGKI